MTRKISSSFQWLLHISFLGKILKDHPEDYLSSIKEVGKEIGRRLVDDFCCRHLIFVKIPDSEIRRYIGIFLESYFEKDIQIDGEYIVFANVILRNQRAPGLELFKQILETVFHSLNDNIQFDVRSNGCICISFKCIQKTS